MNRARVRAEKRLAVYSGGQESAFLGWFSGNVWQWGRLGETEAGGMVFEDVTHRLAFDPAWDVKRRNECHWQDEAGRWHSGIVQAISATTTGRRIEAFLSTVIFESEIDPPADDGSNDLPKIGQPAASIKVLKQVGTDPDFGFPVTYSDAEPPDESWFNQYGSGPAFEWYDESCGAHSGDYRDADNTEWVGGGC